MGKRLSENLSSLYVGAANKLKPKCSRRKIIAYVESYDDISFWRTLLGEYENETRYFEVMLPSKTTLAKGKKSVLMNELGPRLGQNMIACVDSDYDYLLQGATHTSRYIINNKYVFHTYAYAIENYQCYAEALHEVCVMATLNDHPLVDFVAFMRMYSQIAYPLFIWSVWFYRKHNLSEFSLNYAAISNKDFKWTIDLNGTSYKNRITKLPQAEVNAGVFKWREGESRYNFWGIEYAGVNPETGNDQYWKTIYETNDKGEKVVKERVKTENYNEVTSDSQQKYLGDAIPKLFGGFTNNFSYKGIDLSFMIYYSIGGKLYDSDYAQSMYYRRGYSMHPDMLDSWTPENPNAEFPRLTTYYNYANYMSSYTSKFIFNNSFARLRNVTLGYTLPKNFTKKFQVNSLRLFVQGDNLVTIGSAARRGTDPEQSISGTTANRFPVTKSVSFGLQLNL